jgi:hypothetical protein
MEANTNSNNIVEKVRNAREMPMPQKIETETPPLAHPNL